MSDGWQLSGSSAPPPPPKPPKTHLFYEAGIEEGCGGTDAYWTPLPSSLSSYILSSLHSCSPPFSLASHEPATMIDPTSNSTVTCKSIYVHIYYPYQIHTDVFLHLPFSEPLALS